MMSKAASQDSTGTNMINVVLFGEFGCGNLGNEASFSSVLGWLLDLPGVTVRSITREPDAVMRMHGIGSMSMYGDRDRLAPLPRKVRGALGKLTDLVRTMRIINPGEIVLVPGTGVFEQKLGGPPWGLALNLASLSIATRIRRAKLGFVGVGASPDTRRVVRWMTRVTLGNADFLTVRDAYSRAALVGTGVAVPEASVYPDVAFGRADGGGADRQDAGADPTSLRIGVGVIAFHDSDDPERGAAIAQRYEELLTDFCAQLIQAGHRVQLLIGDAGDADVARRVLAGAGSRVPVPTIESHAGSIEFRPVDRYEDLLEQLSCLDLVVASRYHNLILGLASGLPVLSVGYADKCQVLLDSAGLGRYSVPLESADLESVRLRFAELVEHLDQARTKSQAYADRSAADSASHRRSLIDFVTNQRSARRQ